MDNLKAFEIAADAWSHAHPYVLVVLSLASAHRRLLFKLVVLGAVKRFPWILGRKDEIIADAQEVVDEIKANLNAAAGQPEQPSGKPSAQG